MNNFHQSAKNAARLQDSDPTVRKNAAAYFTRNPNPNYIRTLRDALIRESDSKTITWLSHALAKSQDRYSYQIIREKSNLLAEVSLKDKVWLDISLEILSPKRNPLHILDLSNSNFNDDKVSSIILSYAYKEKPENLIRKLVSEADNNSDPYARQWAVLSLGNTSNLTNSDRIIHKLQDPDSSVREWSAWALSCIRDVRSIETLKICLDDPEPRVREWVFKALGQFSNSKTYDMLISQYYVETDELCKEGIIRTLSFKDNERVNKFLEREVYEADYRNQPYLTLALVDSLSKRTFSTQVLDKLQSSLRQTDSQTLKDAVFDALCFNTNPNYLKLLQNAVDDPFFKVLLQEMQSSEQYLISRMKNVTTDESMIESNLIVHGQSNLVQDTIVGGHLIQFNFTTMDRNSDSSRSNQEIKGVEAKGDVVQDAIASQAKQSIEKLKSGGSIKQTTRSSKDILKIGGWSAYGAVAIVGVVVVAAIVKFAPIVLEMIAPSEKIQMQNKQK